MKYLGWRQIKEAIEDREFLFEHADTPRQIFFPMDRGVSDFSDSIWTTIEKLADFCSVDAIQMLRQIEEARDDTFAFRLFGDSGDDSFIPFSFIKSMLKGAEGMLLSSAHTVLKPQIFHPRMNRAEARRLIEATRFRHTEPGSFVLKVSCPIHALESEGEAQTELLQMVEDAPFVRKVTALIHKSLSKIVQSIEDDTIEAYIEQEKGNRTPLISYNICEAVAGFSGNNQSLEIDPRWSILLDVSEELRRKVVITNDYFRRFHEIAKELKPREREVEDTFIGTVEELEGVLDDEGNRSGDVVLHILVPDGDPIRARANLDVNQYRTADQAHMNGRTPYVKLRGRLRPGNQPQRITNLSLFQSISASD
ncbi:MAG: hypothetical protein HC841_05690 [Verrucomicrobiae bacterium]|nr:hypothetical protein [Verrucomicrobiae bacterium]